jgi:hypothetical protein
MRIVSLISLLLLMVGCSDKDLSYVSIRNDTGIAIYALPYTSEYTEGEWIEPGATDEFYSISSNSLNGYEYFSFYYDSVVVLIKDHEEEPVKFYKDGTTINYDPTLNPFTNPEVWDTQGFYDDLPSSIFDGFEKKHILEHFFSIDASSIKSLGDTLTFELNPAF